ncbi:23S rRNA (adenine(2503)-C(2))-methyltransferase RlmN [Desulfobacterota bacterium AH_259_B03_O07]|nr:23S rRNA (adenine(2503)-C(2))-methyltransferase RlmN [Desulfobacterota bacterium AH_259_B03_O07]
MSNMNAKDLCPEELEQFVVSFGEKPYRASQIAKWIYRDNAISFAQMTNLSKEFRSSLDKNLLLNSTMSVAEEKISRDGTIKFLFELFDGKRIESVLIPDKTRMTLCISTQVGCAIGCTFCLTGRIGKIRNLRASEILDQYLMVNKRDTRRITNLVFMGMGEPLDNFDNTLRALKTFTNKDYIGLSPKKITVSTSGLIPRIRELGNQISINLSISLNAPDDELRNELMPINRRYPLKDLIEVSRNFPVPKRKSLTFEYVLIKGVNDSSDDARTLGKLLRGIRCKVNLIPFNEANPLPYHTPDTEQVANFQRILISYGINARIRKNRGRDIMGACGQLAANYPTSEVMKGRKKIRDHELRQS